LGVRVNSSSAFAKVRQGSPALLSGLLSKLAAGGGILTIRSPRHQKDLREIAREKIDLKPDEFAGAGLR